MHRLQDKASTYAGPMDVVKKVVKSEGPLGTSGAIEIALVLTEAWIAGTGLYAGMEATMWRSVS